MNLSNAIFTDHALLQMAKRQLTRQQVLETLADEHHEVLTMRPGRILVQSIVAMGQPPRDYLIRVVVDVDAQIPEVVTAYRTSKINKYRSRP